MSANNRGSARPAPTLNQLVGMAFGGIYLLVGILGFFVHSNGFAATSGGKLIGLFEVNPLHNVAHLLIGAVLAGAGYSGPRNAKAANTAVGAAYLLLGVLGLFILDSSANILALNAADNGLHFVSALLLLVVGLAGDRLQPRGAASR